MYILVSALLAAVIDEDVRWPGLGVFSVIKSRRMPGFPQHKRLGLQMSPHLFRALNDGRPPPSSATGGSTAWIPDANVADQAIVAIEDGLRRQGRAVVSGLGTLLVEQRTLADVAQFFVILRTDPAALRLLNPADEAYEAAVGAEYPEGPPADSTFEA